VTCVCVCLCEAHDVGINRVLDGGMCGSPSSNLGLAKEVEEADHRVGIN